MPSSSLGKKRLVGIALFAVILALFFSFNRFPKLDIVGEDLDAVTAPQAQCFQGFCIEREAGSSFMSRWWSFSVTYLRLVTIGMTFAFLVAGLTEAFLFPSASGTGFLSGGIFKRTVKGMAVGPVMNLCSACIVPVSAAYRRSGGGIEGAIAMVQGSATMNIPALAMVFFVFTPLLGFSRLILAVVGALLIGPIVVMSVRKKSGETAEADEPPLYLELPDVTPWKPALTEAFRDWAKTSVGYLARMGPIMVGAGFASGLAIQWISPEAVRDYLGPDVVGIGIAATVGVLINVPLLFEIPLVALLLLMGMGTAPAATLLFTAAAGGPVTFWGLAKIMPKRAIATFAAATWGVGALGGLVVLGALLLLDPGGGSAEAAATLDEPVTPKPPAYDGPIFADVTASAGIDFVHRQPKESEFPFGAGVVIFDFNGDGRDDIYVANSAGANALYLNNGDETFTDVAAVAGVDDPLGEGNGGCSADYDNDGDQDLYVTNGGSSRLFRNQGDGTFLDVAGVAGASEAHSAYRSTGCAWGDYDGDGFSDLIVVYHKQSGADRVTPLGGLVLLRNVGDGTFSNVTALLGDLPVASSAEGTQLQYREPGSLGALMGAGFQPGWVDFDNDGDLDLYVVNDFGHEIHGNVLWRNDGKGQEGGWSFADISAESGTDVRMFGMALAVGDYDRDGRLDFYMTNIGDNVLLRNSGDGATFSDATSEAGAGAGTLAEMQRVSWAAFFFDYDNDGDEDLYVVSGFLEGGIVANPQEQPNVLLQNSGDGTFADVSPVSGANDAGFGRGGGYLDFNNDGCLDLFVANYQQHAKLFRNNCARGNNWLQIKTVGTTSNRDGIGARITVVAGGKSQVRQISAGASSMSQNSLLAHFGLGEANLAQYVLIKWPGGKIQTLIDVAANQRITVAEPQ